MSGQFCGSSFALVYGVGDTICVADIGAGSIDCQPVKFLVNDVDISAIWPMEFLPGMSWIAATASRPCLRMCGRQAAAEPRMSFAWTDDPSHDDRVQHVFFMDAQPLICILGNVRLSSDLMKICSLMKLLAFRFFRGRPDRRRRPWRRYCRICRQTATCRGPVSGWNRCWGGCWRLHPCRAVPPG